MKTILTFIILLLMTSCGTAVMTVSTVSYQSVRNVKADVPDKASKNASIMVHNSISPDGTLNVYITNLTDNVMVIDRTMSFFVNSDGKSTAFYDPTMTTSTTTDVVSSTSGVGVNLGAVSSAVGVSGVLGRALSGINVGSSSTSSTAVSNTTYSIDQPTVAVGPPAILLAGLGASAGGVGLALPVMLGPGDDVENCYQYLPSTTNNDLIH